MIARVAAAKVQKMDLSIVSSRFQERLGGPDGQILATAGLLIAVQFSDLYRIERVE